jgi:hypothetical protein
LEGVKLLEENAKEYGIGDSFPLDKEPDNPKIELTRQRSFFSVAGCAILAFVCVAILVIAAPQFLESRRLSGESSAIGSLRTINAAQGIFIERGKNKRYGTLRDLEAAGYIDEVLGSGVKQGHKFEVQLIDGAKHGYWVKVSPVIPGETGYRYWLTNQTEVSYFSLEDFKVDRATGKANRDLQPIGGH